MAIDDTSSNQDLGIDESEKTGILAGLNLKKNKIEIPNVNIDLGQNNSQQEESSQSNQQQSQEEPSNSGSSGEGLNLNIDIPSVDINLPKVDMPNVDTPSVDLNTPDINIDTKPITDLTDSVIDTTIDTGNTIADTTLSAANQFYDMTQNFFEPTVEKTGEVIQDTADTAFSIAEPVAEKTGEVVSGVANEAGKALEPVAGIAKEFVDTVGDAIQPAAEFIKNATRPVQDAVNAAISPITEQLGEDANYLLGSSSITKGDGSDYGHVAIGGTGYSVDMSKVVDDAYSNITQGTQLEGTQGKDVYNLATNPSEYIKNQSESVTVDTLTNNLGMDSSLANSVVQAMQDPNKFVETASKEQVTDLISAGTGVDSGLVGAGLDILSSHDAGKTVQKIAETAIKNTATNSTVHTISGIVNSVVPGAGVVAEVLAAVFHYSCYLSTGAYALNYLTKEEYLEFTRYRINIQSKEKTAHQVWIGYQIAFKPVYRLMLKNKLFAKLVMKTWVNPWKNYIRNNYSLYDYVMAKSIKYISLFAYYLLPIKSHKLTKASSGVNVMDVYRKNIKFFESCKKGALVHV